MMAERTNGAFALWPELEDDVFVAEMDGDQFEPIEVGQGTIDFHGAFLRARAAHDWIRIHPISNSSRRLHQK